MIKKAITVFRNKKYYMKRKFSMMIEKATAKLRQQKC